MNEIIDENALIEHAITEMFDAFRTSHDTLIRKVVNKAKGSFAISEKDLQGMLQKIGDRMRFLVENMTGNYADYSIQFKSQLG